jgi:glutaredoxin 3
MKEIRIYTMPDCVYCKKLKSKLENEGIEYYDVDVSDEKNEEEFEKLTKISGNDYVPMILINKKHLLAPDKSFKTIDQAFKLIMEFMNKN